MPCHWILLLSPECPCNQLDLYHENRFSRVKESWIITYQEVAIFTSSLECPERLV